MPDEYMKWYVHEFKQAIKNYENLFEFVFTNDANVANWYFYTKQFPDMMPFLCIMDKSRNLVVAPENKLDELDSLLKTEVKENEKFHYFQSVTPVFLNSMKTDIEEALSKFVDK